MRTASVLLPIAVATLALAVGGALAQPERRKSPVPLSKAELRVCMAREDELNTRVSALQSAQRESNAAIARLSEEAKVLAEELRALSESDKAAVEAFNNRNEARNAQVEAHNKKVEALNAAGVALQEDQASYLETCASRPYFIQDKNAILKEQGKQPVTPGKGQPDGKVKVRPERSSV